MPRRASAMAAVLRTVRVVVVLGCLAVALEFSLNLLHSHGYDAPLPCGLRAEGSHVVRLNPAFEGTCRRGILYATNSFGFRDDAIDPNARHIVFLGDGATFGLNIDHAYTYPEVLEDELATRGIVCQSVNTASPGQATLDQLMMLREMCECEHVNLEAIVLGFFHDDFSGNMVARSLRPSDFPASLSWMSGLRRTRTWKWFSREWRSARDRRARDRVAEGLARPPIDSVGEYTRLPGFEVECDWLTVEGIARNRSYVLTLEALDDIVELSRARGLPLVFVHFPAGESEIYGDFRPGYKQLLFAHLASRDGVICLDVAELYRDYLAKHTLDALPEGFYSREKNCCHPGPIACCVVARELAAVLAEAMAT